MQLHVFLCSLERCVTGICNKQDFIKKMKSMLWCYNASSCPYIHEYSVVWQVTKVRLCIVISQNMFHYWPFLHHCAETYIQCLPGQILSVALCFLPVFIYFSILTSVILSSFLCLYFGIFLFVSPLIMSQFLVQSSSNSVFIKYNPLNINLYHLDIWNTTLFISFIIFNLNFVMNS